MERKPENTVNTERYGKGVAGGYEWWKSQKRVLILYENFACVTSRNVLFQWSYYTAVLVLSHTGYIVVTLFILCNEIKT